MSDTNGLLGRKEVTALAGISPTVFERFVKQGALRPTVMERKSGGRRRWSIADAAKVIRLADVWRRLAPLLPGRGRPSGLTFLIQDGHQVALSARIAQALPRCPAGGVLIISQTGVRASAGKEPAREMVRKAAGPVVIVSAP